MGRKGSQRIAVPAQQLRNVEARGGRMKRQVPGLADAGRDNRAEIPDGVFLVRVDSAHYRWHAQKPFYVLRLFVLEPKDYAGQAIVGRLYCTQKAMWKL